MKKLAVLSVCALSVGILAGCGNSFDASAYTKAVLDNSYKNDSTGFVELKVGTAEESAEIYQNGLDEMVDSFLFGLDVTEEQEAGFEEAIANILASAKYTVGEAEKQDDGSYVVNVTYEKMDVFVEAIELYKADITEMMENMTEIPSDEELEEALVNSLKDCLLEATETATYEEAATTTITIEIEDNLYTPNEDDLIRLSESLFDYEAVNNLN
ncbi:MAG: hypothetical protein PUD93_03950 [Lachnospiraceae bacterium]|nr:hypothetical protein [Lachnospiraceae bacterium]